MTKCCVEGCDREARFACFSPTGDGYLIGYYCEQHGRIMMDDGYGRLCRWFEILKMGRENRTLREMLEREGGEVSLERAAYLLHMSEQSVLSRAKEEGVTIIEKIIPHLNIRSIFLTLRK